MIERSHMRERAFTAGWLVAAAVLSSWAVSSASDQPRAGRAAPERARVDQLPAVSIEIETQIAKMAARTGGAPAASAPARNPFEFGSRTAVPAARVTRPVVKADPVLPTALPAEPVAPIEAAPLLSAVAEMSGTLTAVISFRDDLHYVKKGDVLAGRYRVESVSVDGVNIFDLTVGTILRLSLQSVT